MAIRTTGRGFNSAATILALAVVATGCGKNSSSSPTAATCPSGALQCTTLSANRCNGFVIESCAEDADGCLAWVPGIDCSDSGAVCDASGTVPECVGGDGSGGSGGGSSTGHAGEGGDATGGAAQAGSSATGGTAQAGSPATGGTAQAGSPATGGQIGATGGATTGGGGGTETGGGGTETGGGGTETGGGGTETGGGGTETGGGGTETGGSGTETGGSGTGGSPGTCEDLAMNQDETDVDCGGTICPLCDLGEGCLIADDCDSGNCDAGDTWQCVSPSTPTCEDGERNQDETDVDCGGVQCDPCLEGEACKVHADCTTGVCDYTGGHICIVASPTYQIDEDFETGDLSLFPYGLTGEDPWEVVNEPADCHGGDYCLRTNTNHQLGATTTIELPLSVREDTLVRFYARVNTEPGEHILRFYLDGVEQTSVSGADTGWQLYEFPVPATGPNGPDRVLTWEFERSTFVSPDHAPWMEVWIDDIDVPDWNTAPAPPDLVRPWDDKVTTDLTPTFQWQGFDPDFDTITYEFHYDTDPAFPTPFSTGETNDTTYTPLTDLDDDQTYYWRVRAKDDSDYRWSDWSDVWAVHVDSSHEYSAIWRQSVTAQFETNTLTAVHTDGDRMSTNGTYDETTAFLTVVDGQRRVYTFNGTPPASGSGNVHVTCRGDFDGPSTEYVSLTAIEDTTLSTNWSPNGCDVNSTRTFAIADMGQYVDDGSTTVTVQVTAAVDAGVCNGGVCSVRLAYSGNTGTVVSTPINFAMFGGKRYWDKIQWVGTGTVDIQVLDENLDLIPDSVIPGNSAGLTDRTIHLFDVDPELYPVIHLQANLGIGSSIEEWTVLGNDAFEWTFANDGDVEGWTEHDNGATPTLTAAGGLLRYDGLAAGTDPNIQFVFPQPVDATRFSTIEVRVRTSNNYQNDDFTLYWQSNYGLFDARRSMTQNHFLQSFQDLPFDLTVVPSAPDEPWQGMIEAIRVDPVDHFVGQTLEPADGWFEIERITLY